MPSPLLRTRSLLLGLLVVAGVVGCGAPHVPPPPPGENVPPKYSYEVVDAGPPGPTALIYRGPGACQGCPEALGLLFAAAHYTPKYVGPQELLSDATFKDAAVYVQPGGDDTMSVYGAVGPANWSGVAGRIQDYVKGGGRYLGVCLGGFLAATWMDDASTIPALRLVPFDAHYFTATPKPYTKDQVIEVKWLFPPQTRSVYFQEGPYFDHPPDAGVPYATYGDGTTAAVLSPYGQGKVALSGIHFEAQQSWYDHYNLTDPDGLDADLGEILIRDLMAK